VEFLLSLYSQRILDVPGSATFPIVMKNHLFG
jgi:hypothetical protein